MRMALKRFFHVLGVSCLVAATSNQVLVFFFIQLYGRVTMFENILWIRYGEILLSIFGVSYALYLMVTRTKSFLKEVRHSEV